MKQKTIKINGTEYPVVFTLKTLIAFEDITKTGFFDSDLSTTRNRVALIIAAALAADESTKLSADMIMSADSFAGYQEVMDAYNIIDALGAEFFKMPESQKGKKDQHKKN